MGTFNTRFSLRSSNTFRNQISQRHDRTIAVDNHINSSTKLITQTTSGSPFTILDGDEYHDASETGATANQIFVFIRNTTTLAGKVINVQFNNNGTRDSVILLGPGEYTFFPWNCSATTDDIEVFSNDSAGVRVEYLAAPMK